MEASQWLPLLGVGQRTACREAEGKFWGVAGILDLMGMVCVCTKSLQVCPTLFDSMNCSPPDSFVHGILQAKILKLVAISFSRGFSWPRDQTHISWVSCIGRWILYHFVTWEAWAWWLHKYKFTETHWTVYLKWINSLGNGAVKIYLTDCSWQNPFAFAVSCGSER